jgi:hypothetical protein
MFFDTPTRADGLQQIEIYDFLAAARADHCRRPQIFAFAAEINRKRFDCLRHLLYANGTIWF